MMKDNEYQPPKIWTENNASGGVWSKINRPTAGARYEADLPVGKHRCSSIPWVHRMAKR